MSQNPKSFPDGSHLCESPDCELTVLYDDEPNCFKHSPDSGSFIPGYSYKRENNLL